MTFNPLNPNEAKLKIDELCKKFQNSLDYKEAIDKMGFSIKYPIKTDSDKQNWIRRLYCYDIKKELPKDQSNNAHYRALKDYFKKIEKKTSHKTIERDITIVKECLTDKQYQSFIF